MHTYLVETINTLQAFTQKRLRFHLRNGHGLKTFSVVTHTGFFKDQLLVGNQTMEKFKWNYLLPTSYRYYNENIYLSCS